MCGVKVDKEAREGRGGENEEGKREKKHSSSCVCVRVHELFDVSASAAG